MVSTYTGVNEVHQPGQLQHQSARPPRWHQSTQGKYKYSDECYFFH